MTKKRKNVRGSRKKRVFLFTVLIVIAAVFVPLATVFSTTVGDIETRVTSNQIAFSAEEQNALKQQKADAILVLGASVTPQGTPSYMLADRLDVGIALYKAGVAPKLLLSGDNGTEEYNEVKVMKEYALEHGVKAKDIFLDHAGFSTYESMYRAKAVFQATSLIVVTQSYHEYRALYDAERMGIRVLGVSSDQQTYRGQSLRNLREILAWEKDFYFGIFKPKPKFLGDTIDLSGDGHVSW